MGRKKALFVTAIVFSLLTILFFVGFVFSVYDSDISGFTDDLEYSEGIVKDISPSLDREQKSVAYAISLEGNILLTIDTDAMLDEYEISRVNKGDKIIFAFSSSAERSIEDRVFVTPAFLSCDDKIIVSIESYEEALIKEHNRATYLGLVAVIFFFAVSVTFYFLWIRNIRRNKKTGDGSLS